MIEPAATVLVAGGAGYIGSHAVLDLLNAGYKVLVVDNFTTGYRQLVHEGATLLEGDFGDADFIGKVFSDYAIDAVMHFAAFSIVPESVGNPLKYYLNNVRSTLTLLNAMLENDCRYFILSSTAAVYGEPEETPITEDLPKNPKNPYGRTKLILEQTLADLAAATPLRFVSLRYFNAAGADPEGRCGELHNPETHLIPLVLQAAMGKRESISVFGTDYPTPDGTCVRDYIHVADLSRAHMLALEHLLEGGDSEIFNLGNGNGYSVREVIESVRRVTGKDFKVVEAERREGDPAILVASSEKIRTELDFEAAYPELDAIVRTAWEWAQKAYE